MAEFSACYTLIMQLMQKSELQRFKADRKISAAKVDGIERQRRQVQRDIENVRNVADSAAEFQVLIEETIARLEQFNHRQRQQREREAA